MIAEAKGNASSGPDCEVLREAGLRAYHRFLDSAHTDRKRRETTWTQEELDRLESIHEAQRQAAAGILAGFLQEQFTSDREHAVRELKALAAAIECGKTDRRKPTQQAKLLEAIFLKARSDMELPNAEELASETGVNRREASAALVAVTERTGIRHEDRRSSLSP